MKRHRDIASSAQDDDPAGRMDDLLFGVHAATAADDDDADDDERPIVSTAPAPKRTSAPPMRNKKAARGSRGTDALDDDDDDDEERPLASAATATTPVAEFSDDDDDGGTHAAAAAASDASAPANPLVNLATSLQTPISLLNQEQDPHVAVERAFQRRDARTARPRYDGTLDAPMAALPLALDDAARRDRTVAAMNGDQRARVMMTRLYGTCPQPTENGLEAEVDRLMRYLRHVPPYRARAAGTIRAQVEQCVVNRETPARWDDLHRYLRWRSARDDVHYMVEAGWRTSPTTGLRIRSRPCVNADRCMGFRTFPQLAGCPPQSFMPIGYITKEELAQHYATGKWPDAGAGNVPCIFCTWYVPFYLQCAIPMERGNQWLPFVVAQSDFNSVDTFHGYRSEHVLRRSGQHDSIVLAPLGKWDSNALVIYFDAEMGLHRVNHDRMLVAPMGTAPSLARFETDVHPPDATECVTASALAVPSARASSIIATQAATARPAPLPAPAAAAAAAAQAAPTRRPEPFFGPGARPRTAGAERK